MNNNDSTNHSQDQQSEEPPDRAASGDLSTTGVSSHDMHNADERTAPAHGAQDDHGADTAHNGHDGHDDDAAEVSTLVPTSWKQLILPALILLLVGILVAGPLFGAFATRPPTSQPTDNNNTSPPQSTAIPGPEGGAPPTSKAISQQTGSTTQAPLPDNTPTSSLKGTRLALNPGSIATRTAVALAGEQGDVARLPVQLEFGGSSFIVKPGSNLLPDWELPQDLGIATWIEGTVANHIMYVPYNTENAALFKSAKPGATISLTMNTGQVFVFAITRAQRAANGPATSDGQFTVTTAMRQDHAGVTLFLIGDPADDRAVVQADFIEILSFEF